MDSARLAERINRLPFAQLLGATESALWLGVEEDEALRLLRAGRRQGMITVRRNREVGSVEFMRVRRHPAAPNRQEKVHS
ncbi:MULTISPECIES: hypothetical protein [unclassified Streptomyces]|uniref:hypothetical protein n=1 Tax=unclassified Streptomyces TaxID=2593676 RepID=UPI0035E397FC